MVMLGENIKMINVNSNEWWEEYFGEKKWEQNQGNAQTFFSETFFWKILI